MGETSSGIESIEVDEVIEIIKDIRATGVGLVVVEHVMRAIRKLSDRVIVLHHGEKIAEGAFGEVATNPRVVEAYLGTSATERK